MVGNFVFVSILLFILCLTQPSHVIVTWIVGCFVNYCHGCNPFLPVSALVYHITQIQATVCSDACHVRDWWSSLVLSLPQPFPGSQLSSDLFWYSEMTSICCLSRCSLSGFGIGLLGYQSVPFSMGATGKSRC